MNILGVNIARNQAIHDIVKLFSRYNIGEDKVKPIFFKIAANEYSKGLTTDFYIPTLLNDDSVFSLTDAFYIECNKFDISPVLPDIKKIISYYHSIKTKLIMPLVNISVAAISTKFYLKIAYGKLNCKYQISEEIYNKYLTTKCLSYVYSIIVVMVNTETQNLKLMNERFDQYAKFLTLNSNLIRI